MKYMFQMGLISGICLIGELLGKILPLPIPASVYGMVILFILLLTKIVKLEQVEDVADYLLLIMPLFFISPIVGIINALPYLQGKITIVLLVILFSTFVTTVVTGLVAQAFIRFKNTRKRGR